MQENRVMIFVKLIFDFFFIYSVRNVIIITGEFFNNNKFAKVKSKMLAKKVKKKQ
ncbi:hypothetical protein RCH33_2950 [Flavobacterium daejeonense]|nr:hypothetical protein RCH33_2950 [Flavobacterium daejeonense]